MYIAVIKREREKSDDEIKVAEKVSNQICFSSAIKHVHMCLLFPNLGNKTWPMKSQEICFFACKSSFTYFMGN